MVPPSSHRVPRVRRYSGYSLLSFNFGYVALTLCRWPSQTILLSKPSRDASPYPCNVATTGLAYSDFARHYFRNRSYFLFLRVLRCFSSPGSPHLPMDSVNDTATLLAVRSRIRISADLCSFAAPRGFSQLVTSFLGAMYLGILRMLFVA